MFMVGLTEVLREGAHLGLCQLCSFVYISFRIIHDRHWERPYESRCFDLQECETPIDSIAFTVVSADVTNAVDGVCRWQLVAPPSECLEYHQQQQTV